MSTPDIPSATPVDGVLIVPEQLWACATMRWSSFAHVSENVAPFIVTNGSAFIWAGGFLLMGELCSPGTAQDFLTENPISRLAEMWTPAILRVRNVSGERDNETLDWEAERGWKRLKSTEAAASLCHLNCWAVIITE